MKVTRISFILIFLLTFFALSSAFGQLSIYEVTRLPCIDKYGQYMHKEWPDKVHTDDDFKAQLAREKAEMSEKPGPEGWDRYGGWADGPQLEATGTFRVEKVEDKWWFVDPEGRLFWSLGLDRVTTCSSETPIEGREKYFAELPESDSPFAEFYNSHDELLRPYYVRWNMDKTYDFSGANLKRKYGEYWFDLYADLIHRRLRSWGMNTLGNSSDVRIRMMSRTPYADRITIQAVEIEGAEMSWEKLPDPFASEFVRNLRSSLKKRRDEIANPWCFGFFVDNELIWGTPTSPAAWTLASSDTQPAKVEFVKRLKKKYREIDALNSAWQTSHDDWKSLLYSRTVPGKGAEADLREFSDALVEQYFSTVQREFKRYYPDKLYLGCRFANANERVIRTAAKYCDVLSFNIYRYKVDNFRLPTGIDKPVLVGEFQFGALDRGLLRASKIRVRDQEARARAFYDYVQSALENPLFVGVHWHQYADQPTAGRFDGRNYQNGFLSVTDTPYWETIAKSREIGYQLYRMRYGKDYVPEPEPKTELEPKPEPESPAK